MGRGVGNGMFCKLFFGGIPNCTIQIFFCDRVEAIIGKDLKNIQKTKETSAERTWPP